MKSYRYAFGRALLVLIAAAVLWQYAIPKSFESIMPDYETGKADKCCSEYFYRTETDGKPHYYIREYAFDVNSEEYGELIDILSSTGYRKQVSNIFGGGSVNGYSITLEPHASIYFCQGDSMYELSLYGMDVPAGISPERKDYSPTGGMAFQKRAVEFICENGTLLEEYEP